MIKVSDMVVANEVKKPKVSIILPVYNVEAYLDRCFESICEQSFSDFEVLAVDDGSTDNSGIICDEWARKDSRIIALHKNNGGLSDARNYGLDRAQGEYFTCIDSDDFVTSDYLQTLLSLFKYAPGCLMVGAGHYIVRCNNNSLDYHSGQEVTVLSRRDAFSSVLYHGIVNVSAWAKMYHKSLFKDLRYPVGRIYEDTYIFGHLLNMTPFFVFSSKPVYYYCKRNDSIVSGEYDFKRLQFIDAVDKLVQEAKECDSSLQNACLRREIHARLSVLRYMGNVKGADLILRRKLRNEVLSQADAVCNDKLTPRRDKIAIRLLKFGFYPYYLCWSLYERFRYKLIL